MTETTKRKRFIWRVAVGSFVLILALFMGMRMYVVRGFPQTDGIVEVQGLDKPVTIIRDNWGVPHIYADTERDALFAQGFVHAQDRRFQMEGISRSIFGRLTGLAGESALEQDMVIRSYDFYSLAKRIADDLSPRVKDGIEAYCDGVNAAYESDPKRLPLEFRSIDMVPEPWTVEDVVGVFLLNVWYLSLNYPEERLEADLSSILTKGEIELLIGFEEPSYEPLDVPEPGPEEVARLMIEMGLSGGAASNNWVVGPAKSKSGSPLLANDPHLLLTLPSVWYELHVECPEFKFAGFSMPGAPFIAIGRNERVAWGFTNVMTDNTDIVLEKVKPQTLEVLTPEGWTALVSRQETFEVKDSGDVTETYYASPNGPITKMPSDDKLDEDGIGIAYALRWVGYHDKSSFEAFEQMIRAKNSHDLIQAVSLFDSLSQNLAYVDLDGNFGWQAFGKVPIRQGYSGKYPVNGWEPDKKWIGYVPFDMLPGIRNPEKGYVQSANSDSDDGLDFTISNTFVRPYRYKRIGMLLDSKDKFDLRDMAEIQGDTVTLQAPSYIEAVVDVADGDAELQPMVDLLKNWNRDLDRDSAGAAFYEVFIRNLWRAWLADELGEYFVPFAVRKIGMGSVMDEYVLDPNNIFWDDRSTTDKTEFREDIIKQALHDAEKELTATLGPNPNSWSWGALHGALFEHPAGGGVLTSNLLNFGPIPVGGDYHTVNANSWSIAGDYRVFTIPSMRFLFDTADPDHPLSIIATGQSGHPGNDHYSDQAQMWADIEYKTQLWLRTEIEQAQQSSLTLLPVSKSEAR